jgi:hypothetical protein
MFPGAFVLKLKTRQWRLCVVKQVPSDVRSKWMLFGERKIKPRERFQLEFTSHQEMQMINHIVNMAMTKLATEAAYAEISLVLITDPPATSSIETLWSLKGIEMYCGNRICTPERLYNALHQDVYMLSLTPQTSQSQPQSRNSKPHRHAHAHHPMKTRSRDLTEN